jgi:alkanesulfonate monooxygenase SsuD/methylene tetrahydromethanopterin reductase-like flavin-dependent oxidoreductase (luciferase family)
MHFGLSLCTFGPYSDSRLVADLAREAEEAGWDGCFLWDHIQVRGLDAAADPWITLTAIVLATRRIRIGTLVTPLYRRHPWKVARETVTLDHLSHGRLILGVGLGSDAFGEITAFGGPLDDRVRAGMLDEGLEVLKGLWSGNSFSFEGAHFRVSDARFLPTPMQAARIPIWVAGTWPRRPPFRRAARYDGVIPVAGDIRSPLSPPELRDVIAYVRQFRKAAATDARYDVVYSGDTPGVNGDQDREIIAPYAAAGATWWLESVLPWERGPEQARARIRRGPPR